MPEFNTSSTNTNPLLEYSDAFNEVCIGSCGFCLSTLTSQSEILRVEMLLRAKAIFSAKIDPLEAIPAITTSSSSTKVS
ncbi:hypothetical protein D3C86_2016890 [compost metagenome]